MDTPSRRPRPRAFVCRFRPTPEPTLKTAVGILVGLVAAFSVTDAPRLSANAAGWPWLGDAGWFHLAPHVATLLASRGCFVVGFDVRAYLAAFTPAAATLRPEDVPHDYEVLIAFASRHTGRKPI